MNVLRLRLVLYTQQRYGDFDEINHEVDMRDLYS